MITDARHSELTDLLAQKRKGAPIAGADIDDAERALNEAFALNGEIENLRSQETAARDAHDQTHQTAVEAHAASLTAAESDLKEAEGAEQNSRASLDAVGCDQLKRPPLEGATVEEMRRNFDTDLANDLAAYYRLPVTGKRYVETGGVIEPFDPASVKPFAQKTEALPKDKRINAIMLSIDTVAGYVLGIGLLALLGLIRERTFFQSIWPSLTTLVIGMSITVVASIVIRSALVEAARHKRVGQKSWGSWLPIPIGLAMISVEMAGVTKILEQQAIRRQLEGLNGGTSYWIVPFVACLLSGLVVFGAVLSANERNRLETTYEKSVQAEKDAYAQIIRDQKTAHEQARADMAELRKRVIDYVDGYRTQFDDMMRHAQEYIEARRRRIAAREKLESIRSFPPIQAPFHSAHATRIAGLENRQLDLLKRVESVLGPTLPTS